MYHTIAQLHLGAEIEPVKDGTPTDFGRSAGKKSDFEIGRILKIHDFDEKIKIFMFSRARKPFQSCRIVL